MRTVTVKSRFPEIARHLPVYIDVAVYEGAEIVAESAKGKVPVNTGRLRNAIHVRRQGKGEAFVVAGNNEAWYGHIVEHGGAHTPARPFLIPSLHEQTERIVMRVAAGVKRGCE